ncbi:hypothetical protein MOUN0_N02564 [Monosporozyma unispora]|nr:hypothetical protein C6P44_001695 [Kazachstania unispora]
MLPNFLRKLEALKKEINNSAELFHLYHKHVSITFPNYFQGFWKSKFRFLKICAENETSLLNFGKEAREVFGIQSKNFLNLNDIAVGKVMTKIWSVLSEFLEELSCEELWTRLSFFYVPHLLNLKDIVNNCISDVRRAGLNVDLQPLLRRIDGQLYSTANECKAVFAAGALHFTKGRDVINCYEQLMGEKFDLMKELITITFKLYNLKTIIEPLTDTNFEINKEQTLVLKQMLKTDIKKLLNHDYNCWKSLSDQHTCLSSMESELFKNKKLEVNFTTVNDRTNYEYFREGKNLLEALTFSLNSAEKLTCDNIMFSIYLSSLLKSEPKSTRNCENRGNLFASCINYLSPLNVNSLTGFSSVITYLNTQNRLSKVDKICKFKLLLEKGGTCSNDYTFLPSTLLGHLGKLK